MRTCTTVKMARGRRSFVPRRGTTDDLDFAYFAFTLGMCFQTSDVAVLSRTIRRYVLLHALVSFVYNTSIIALSINLASGLFGG